MFLFYTPILDFLYASIRTFLSIYYNSLTILINSSYEYAPLYPGFFVSNLHQLGAGYPSR